MSMVLTVEIQGSTAEDVRQKLQGVSNLLAEEFHGHDQKQDEGDGVRFLLTDTEEIPTA